MALVLVPQALQAAFGKTSLASMLPSPLAWPNAHRRYRRHVRLGIAAACVGALACAVIIIDRRMWLPWPDAAGLALLAFGFLGGHLYLHQRRLLPKLELALGSVGLMLSISLVAGIIAHVGLRFRRPLIDEGLARADRALHVDTMQWVYGLAGPPWIAEVLGVVYNSAVPVVLLSAAALAARGEASRLWQLVYGYTAAILVCAFMHTAWPAVGNIAYHALSSAALTIAGLPNDAGIFHLAAVRYYYAGDADRIIMALFKGVVTFPSFHTVMALLVAFAMRGYGAISALVALWSGAVIVSTIPVGGHYAIDVLAGTALWILLEALIWLPVRNPSVRSPGTAGKSLSAS